MILLKLILAHLIGDFLFQPKAWVEHKEKHKEKSHWLYVHVAVHASITILLLGGVAYWQMIIVIIFSHYIIDLLKLKFQTEKTKTEWFIGDQAMHLLAILISYWVFIQSSVSLEKLPTNAIWIYALALLAVTNVSGIVIQNLMANWSKRLEDKQDESLKDAGKYIGILERLFVFLFVVTGNWGSIGYLLAAKSIFRFGDLKKSKDRKLTEYILIGTLLSFSLAIAVALITQQVMSYYHG